MTDFDLQQQLAQNRYQQYGQQAQYQGPQGKMVGGIYIAPNALEYIAAGLRSVGGMRGQQLAQQEMQDLSGQRQKAVAEALRNFGQASQGQPAAQLPAEEKQAYAQMGDMSPTVGGVKPDMNAAYAGLLNAPDAALRQAGMQGMISMADQQRKQADQQRMMQILQNSTPQQAIASGVPPEMVKSYYESRNYGRDKVVFKDAGGKLVPVTEFGDTPQGVKPIDKTGNPFSDLLVMGPDGTLTPNAPLVQVKGEIARAGRPSITVNNPGPKAFETELGKLDAKQLDEARDQATQAQASLGVVERLRAAESQGAYSGGLADQKLAAANLLNGITGVTPKGLVGSQLYNAEASKLVLQHVKGLGANPSNADREFIEKTVPRLATSAEARQALVQFIEQAAKRTIENYQAMDSYARKNSGLGGYRPPSAVGAQPATSGGAIDFGSLK